MKEQRASDEAPGNQRANTQKLLPKTRKICWHGRKQPAVLSSSCHHSHPTFLGSTVTDEDTPAYTLLSRWRVARRLETPLQGTSKSVPGLAEKEGGRTRRTLRK
ncbi:hypothetical protein OJAV_G00005100 [Oryzias javanicus]|uniref:Uncharacterized protein n=1 Tax=Oryzias javanicus TaxID=123683 RepID=A0A437DMH3_ORYJA|nr:hypothetical protein OJAV_G00005100 [Oryzias javanicus]